MYHACQYIPDPQSTHDHETRVLEKGDNQLTR